MLDEVVGQLVQPVVSGDHLVVLAEQLLQEGDLVWIEVGLFNLLGDAVIEVEPGDAQLLAPVFIHQLHRGLVFLGAFEVVARHVAAKDTPGEVVVLEERRAGEANERGVGERQPHVAGKLSRLRAMRFVRHHDNVVALAVGFCSPPG